MGRREGEEGGGERKEEMKTMVRREGREKEEEIQEGKGRVNHAIHTIKQHTVVTDLRLQEIKAS